ncbi:hypothetical protein GS500_25545 [Rhodococcus hoagii]|nr:hypothetical protein [Prescottella equi]
MAEGARLLVLDNCEQVVDAVAELVQTLLERCAGLHVLTTSRELLGLGCETVIPVSPLTTPSRDRSQPVIKVSRFDAVALFAERAASAVPGFALTDDNTATIAKICARLDGLPLAIELAAARTRALSPEQILQRLIERRGLLTWSSRGVPPRQQTLKWSIGWSYDLCTPEEQQLWRRLSLFTGSFDIDDVEHICGEDCAGDLLDILASLVDKSIIVREDARGRARYRMLDTVRGFGREQLDETAGDVNLRLRFRDWYTRMALDAEADWISPRQLDWSDRLRGELPNLREAFDFAIAENDGSALPLAAALYPFWIARGLFAEGRAGSIAHSTKPTGNRPPSRPNRSSRPRSWPPSKVTSRSPLPEPRTRLHWSRRRRTRLPAPTSRWPPDHSLLQRRPRTGSGTPAVRGGHPRRRRVSATPARGAQSARLGPRR